MVLHYRHDPLGRICCFLIVTCHSDCYWSVTSGVTCYSRLALLLAVTGVLYLNYDDSLPRVDHLWTRVNEDPSSNTTLRNTVTNSPFGTSPSNLPPSNRGWKVTTEVSQVRQTAPPADNTTLRLRPGDSSLPYEDSSSRPQPSPPGHPATPKLGNTDNPPLKKILFWNEVWGKRNFYFGFGREPFVRAGCRVSTCTTTADRTAFPLRDVDAILWHIPSRDMTFPGERWRHTRYVFWMLESPANMHRTIKTFAGVFNWTFTYRLDSDFPMP
ncbi:uncharacterized protein [Procambarus clarkii]|uniref:uncharacterized protein n=1 Tax=Procambarus clarkii TaxID=6728 RepID=UPI003742077E